MQSNRSRLLPPIGCSNTHNHLGGLHWWGPSLSWNQNVLCGPPEGTTLEVIQAHVPDPPRPTPPAGEGFSGKVET
ncbi:unnamed protein product [Arctogadus glacialis]